MFLKFLKLQLLIFLLLCWQWYSFSPKLSFTFHPNSASYLSSFHPDWCLPNPIPVFAEHRFIIFLPFSLLPVMLFKSFIWVFCLSQNLYSLYKAFCITLLIIFTALSLPEILLYSCYASSNFLPPIPEKTFGMPFPPNFSQILLISVRFVSDLEVVVGISQKMVVPRSNRACPSKPRKRSRVLRSTFTLPIIKHSTEGPKAAPWTIC